MAHAHSPFKSYCIGDLEEIKTRVSSRDLLNCDAINCCLQAFAWAKNLSDGELVLIDSRFTETTTTRPIQTWVPTMRNALNNVTVPGESVLRLGCILLVPIFIGSHWSFMAARRDNSQRKHHWYHYDSLGTNSDYARNVVVKRFAKHVLKGPSVFHQCHTPTQHGLWECGYYALFYAWTVISSGSAEVETGDFTQSQMLAFAEVLDVFITRLLVVATKTQGPISTVTHKNKRRL